MFLFPGDLYSNTRLLESPKQILLTLESQNRYSDSGCFFCGYVCVCVCVCLRFRVSICQLTQHESLVALFDNRTWCRQGVAEEFDYISHHHAWKHPQVNVFITLILFTVMKVGDVKGFYALKSNRQRFQTNCDELCLSISFSVFESLAEVTAVSPASSSNPKVTL